MLNTNAKKRTEDTITKSASSKGSGGAATPEPAEKALRVPQQSRSRASYERMLDAAEKLLRESGSDEITLTEVGKRGKVSIGSIYCRFDSKDDLIRAVQQRVSAAITEEQSGMLARLSRHATTLEGLMGMLVDELAESLKRHASILRPMMLRANQDAVVGSMGRSAHDAVARVAVDAMLRFGDDFSHSEKERAARAVYSVIYAALARFLGLGSSMESSEQGDWEDLKFDLASMATAYLTTGKDRAR